MATRILTTEPCYAIAKTIFEEFEVNQSCTIYGWEDGTPRGLIVIERLKDLDLIENTVKGKDGYRRRKRYMPPDSIGGYVASKIFKYQETMRDGKLCYLIWRMQ